MVLIARLGRLVGCSIHAAAQPLLHGVRLAAAVSLALFVAFYLQLDTPSWAGTTAAIVCQPVVGSAILKGAFRLVGTAVGAVAAVGLTAIFPQDRAGFLFGMVVWAAACSFVSTLLRNFAAYAAMLSGYTLIIIAGSSISAPDQVFEIAISRASEISVGIVSGTLIVALTDLGDAPERLSALLSGLIAETAAHLSSALSARAGAEGQMVRRALIKRVAALAPIIDEAAGESPELLQRRSVLRAAAHGSYTCQCAAISLTCVAICCGGLRASTQVYCDRAIESEASWLRASLGTSDTPRHCLDITRLRAVSRSSMATVDAAGDKRLDAMEYR
jgi:hypothetical protein